MSSELKDSECGMVSVKAITVNLDPKMVEEERVNSAPSLNL